MTLRRILAVGVATLLAILVTGRVLAAGSGSTASCTSAPPVVDNGTSQQITITCDVPDPPAVTVTVTATPSPTGTETPTPTPTPTPTATPSPGTFPDASNTGVPAGTALSAYTGPSTISTANTVIDGKTLGCISVTAPGVVIRRSKIECANPSYAVVSVEDGAFTGTSLLLENDEIDCRNGAGTAVGEANVTVRSSDIHGCENGFDMNQGFDIQDSYIHDLWNTAQSHTDGMQMAGAHLENGKWVTGALNLKIRHNTIYGVGADGSLGTSAIISNPRGDKNITIQDNLLAGGAFTLYCDYSATATNYQVIDNEFSTRFSPKYGAYGPSDGCSDETLSGNVDHETGAPMTLD